MLESSLRFAAAFVFLTLSFAELEAQDAKRRVEIVGYTNATLLELGPNGARIVHDGGIAKVPLEKLPQSLQDEVAQAQMMVAERERAATAKAESDAKATRDAKMEKFSAVFKAKRMVKDPSLNDIACLIVLQANGYGTAVAGPVKGATGEEFGLSYLRAAIELFGKPSTSIGSNYYWDAVYKDRIVDKLVAIDLSRTTKHHLIGAFLHKTDGYFAVSAGSAEISFSDVEKELGLVE